MFQEGILQSNHMFREVSMWEILFKPWLRALYLASMSPFLFLPSSPTFVLFLGVAACRGFIDDFYSGIPESTIDCVCQSVFYNKN